MPTYSPSHQYGQQQPHHHQFPHQAPPPPTLSRQSSASTLSTASGSHPIPRSHAPITQPPHLPPMSHHPQGMAMHHQQYPPSHHPQPPQVQHHISGYPPQIVATTTSTANTGNKGQLGHSRQSNQSASYMPLSPYHLQQHSHSYMLPSPGNPMHPSPSHHHQGYGMPIMAPPMHSLSSQQLLLPSIAGSGQLAHMNPPSSHKNRRSAGQSVTSSNPQVSVSNMSPMELMATAAANAAAQSMSRPRVSSQASPPTPMAANNSSGPTNRPRTRTPYIRFCMENRPVLRERHPDATFGELGRMLGLLWQQVSADDRAKYEQPLPDEIEKQLVHLQHQNQNQPMHRLVPNYEHDYEEEDDEEQRYEEENHAQPVASPLVPVKETKGKGIPKTNRIATLGKAIREGQLAEVSRESALASTGTLDDNTTVTEVEECDVEYGERNSFHDLAVAASATTEDSVISEVAGQSRSLQKKRRLSEPLTATSTASGTTDGRKGPRGKYKVKSARLNTTRTQGSVVVAPPTTTLYKAGRIVPTANPVLVPSYESMDQDNDIVNTVSNSSMSTPEKAVAHKAGKRNAPQTQSTEKQTAAIKDLPKLTKAQKKLLMKQQEALVAAGLPSNVIANLGWGMFSGNVGGDEEGEGGGQKEPKKKRKPSAFIVFAREQRRNVMEQYPSASFQEVGKILGLLWGQLPDDQKEKYVIASAHWNVETTVL